MIYLVRHGETNLNKQKKFYGELDVPINHTGMQQAIKIKKQLEIISFSKIYTSEMKRTQQTAKLIMPSQYKKIIALSALNEKSFGKWEGLDANEIQKKYPYEWQSWLDEPFSFTPPQAEPFVDFELRVIHAFQEIITKNQNNILIIGHLGVFRVINKWLYPKSNFWEFHVPQDSFFTLDL